MQIKLSSVQLARKYMKRVATELDAMNEPEKEPNKEFLLLQGVRFAFRVHQVYTVLLDAAEIIEVGKCGIRAHGLSKIVSVCGRVRCREHEGF